MNIEELEKENAALKEENRKLKLWVDYYKEEKDRKRIHDSWIEWADSVPQRNHEIHENYLKSQLPKL